MIRHRSGGGRGGGKANSLQALTRRCATQTRLLALARAVIRSFRPIDRRHNRERHQLLGKRVGSPPPTHPPTPRSSPLPTCTSASRHGCFMHATGAHECCPARVVSCALVDTVISLAPEPSILLLNGTRAVEDGGKGTELLGVCQAVRGSCRRGGAAVPSGTLMGRDETFRSGREPCEPYAGPETSLPETKGSSSRRRTI